MFRQSKQLFIFISMFAVLYSSAMAVETVADQTPQQVLDLRVAAEECIKNKDYPGAREKYQGVIKNYPGTAYAMRAQSKIGIVYVKEGQFDQAETVLDTLSMNYQDHPDVTFAIRNIISVYLEKEDYDTALRLCQNALGQYANQAKIACLKGCLAQTYIRSDQNAKADAVIQSLLDEGPQSAEYENVFGSVISHVGNAYWLHNNQAEKAVAIYKDFLSRYPDNPHTITMHRRLVNTYFQSDQADKALIELDGFLTRYADDDRLAEIAGGFVNLLSRHGAYDKSDQFAQKALSQLSGSEMGLPLQVHVIKGHLRNGDVAKAKAELKVLFDEYAGSAEFVNAGFSISKEFKRNGCYEAATTVCEELLKQDPSHEKVPDILNTLQICNRKMGMGQMNDLDSLIEELLLKHSDSADHYLAIALTCTGMYLEEEEYTWALQISDAALEKYPSHAMAAELLAKQALAYLNLKVPSEAAAVIEKLIAEYQDSGEFGRLMNEIAACCHKMRDYSKALAMYQVVLDSQADLAAQLEAKRGLAQVHVREGNDQAVLEIVNSVIQGYQDEKRLGVSVFVIGEEYYLIAQEAQQLGNQETAKINNYEKALAIWQRNIDQVTDSKFQCMGYYYSAAAYMDMDRYKDAVNFYQYVVTNFPDYEKTWYAQYQIAKCYELLAKENKATIEDAKEAYQKVLDRYPDSSVAKLASRKLSLL